jgi:acetate kinase
VLLSAQQLGQYRGFVPSPANGSAVRARRLPGRGCARNPSRRITASRMAGAFSPLDCFVYRIVLFTTMLAAAMGGIDAFAFTAGIGRIRAIPRPRQGFRLI